MAKYVKTCLSEGCCAVHGKAEGDGSVTITCHLSGRKLNRANFWNGRWAASYSCNVASGGNSSKLEGLVRAVVHVYEEGNVQFDSTKVVSSVLAFESQSAFGVVLAAKV